MKKPGGCWPTPLQHLLLCAILKKDKEALQKWQAQTELERIDLASHKLLPMLYKKDPQNPTLKGMYRFTWSQNKLLFHKAIPVLRNMREAGIPTLLLKGAALIPLYYQDFGLRAMFDFDVMVPVSQAEQAIEIVKSLGWKQIPNRVRSNRKLTQPVFRVINAVSFEDDKGQELDLHWHVLADNCHPDADKLFWEGAVEMEIQGEPTLTLNPTDLLFHVCVHGVKWNVYPPIRWVADAVMILRCDREQIDWDRLVIHAEYHRMILPLRDTLFYLKSEFVPEIPQEVLDRLSALPVKEREMKEFQLRTSPRETLPCIMRDYWYRHMRYTGKEEWWNNLVRLPKFLQSSWALPHLYQVPIHMAKIPLQYLFQKNEEDDT